MSQIYYTAPSDKSFEEMKKTYLEVWKEVTTHPSYLEEKVSRIENIANVQDNFMYMLAMFDSNNQAKVIVLLSEPTKEVVRERMVDGGNTQEYIENIGL